MTYETKKDNFARNFAIIFLSLFIVAVYFVVTEKTEAVITNINSNLDSLPYYVNGDTVIDVIIVDSSATTTTGNYLCIRHHNDSCTNKSVYFTGNNFATNTENGTDSITPEFKYQIRVPLQMLMDTNSTTSADISQALVSWGGSIIYLNRISPSGSNNASLRPYLFHYDKYGTSTRATNIYDSFDIPILNLGILFIIFIMSLGFFLPEMRRSKKSNL